MNANKAKWYGIISTFVAGLLQMTLCYALFTLLFWNEFTGRELEEWFEMFGNFLDVFIPILLLVCLRWSRKIGEQIIIKKEDAYKTSLHHLNWVLTLAYTLSAMGVVAMEIMERGWERTSFYSDPFALFQLIIFILIAGFIAVRFLNYLPTYLGAIPLSGFLRNYQ